MLIAVAVAPARKHLPKIKQLRVVAPNLAHTALKKASSDDKKSCDIKEKSCCGNCGVSEPATSTAKPTIRMPKMSCFPADA